MDDLFNRVDNLFNRVVNFFDFQNKSAEEIIDFFERVLAKLFADNIFNSARFLTAEEFASRIVRRATHIDCLFLSAALKVQINLWREKWYANID